MIKEIVGGVCAAKGFSAGGVHCGVKEGSDPAKKDLALILSEVECQAAAVYTTNRGEGRTHLRYHGASGGRGVPGDHRQLGQRQRLRPREP